MSIEYRGEEILYAVNLGGLIRPFNQTGGNTNLTADEIELDTKDKTGSDYGKVGQEVSLEGIITEGDDFVDGIKEAMRNKEFVEIYEINTRTKEAEKGLYMISAFNRTFTNGEFATYTLNGTLNGSVTEETLTEIPKGAPDSEIDTGDGGGVEG